MKMLGNVDPNTGMPMPGGRAKNPNIGNPNRKKSVIKRRKNSLINSGFLLLKENMNDSK